MAQRHGNNGKTPQTAKERADKGNARAIPVTPSMRRRATPYERTRAAVYATGNRWAIENFEATHGRGW